MEGHAGSMDRLFVEPVGLSMKGATIPTSLGAAGMVFASQPGPAPDLHRALLHPPCPEPGGNQHWNCLLSTGTTPESQGWPLIISILPFQLLTVPTLPCHCPLERSSNTSLAGCSLLPAQDAMAAICQAWHSSPCSEQRGIPCLRAIPTCPWLCQVGIWGWQPCPAAPNPFPAPSLAPGLV